MPKNLKVMFDVDGVLADFILGFTDKGFLKYGTPAEKTVEHKVWDLFPGMDKRMVDGLWRDIEKDDTGFWYNLPPLLTRIEQEYLIDLSTRPGAEVYFVTNRHSKTALIQTREWVKENVFCGLVTPMVICVGSQSKGYMAKALEADFTIDDKIGNAVYISYESRKTRSYLLERPYNKVEPLVIGGSVVRVPTLTHFLADVEDEWLKRQK